MPNSVHRNIKKGVKGGTVGAIAASVGVVAGKIRAAKFHLDNDTEILITGAIISIASAGLMAGLNYFKNRSR